MRRKTKDAEEKTDRTEEGHETEDKRGRRQTAQRKTDETEDRRGR